LVKYYKIFYIHSEELNEEFVARFEKLDALCDKVDILSQDFASLKSLVQSQRSHEETIKFAKEVIDRSWGTLRMMRATTKKITRKKLRNIVVLNKFRRLKYLIIFLMILYLTLKYVFP
jgi:cell shape-determining protein MreC